MQRVRYGLNYMREEGGVFGWWGEAIGDPDNSLLSCNYSMLETHLHLCCR